MEYSYGPRSPVDRLFPELLAHVFTFLQYLPSKNHGIDSSSSGLTFGDPDQQVDDTPGIDYAQLRQLTLVSQYWREIATPILWSTLCFFRQSDLYNVLAGFSHKHLRSRDYGVYV